MPLHKLKPPVFESPLPPPTPTFNYGKMAEIGTLHVIVDRSKWHRGKGSGGSRLLINDPYYPQYKGKMCCLGFGALAAGMAPQTIENSATPSSCVQIGPESKVFPKAYTHQIEGLLTKVNDSTGFSSEAFREDLLRHIGTMGGIYFTFVDGEEPLPTPTPVPPKLHNPC